MKIHYKYLLKSITWRFVGTIDTIVVVYLFSGEIGMSIGVALVASISKIILYYFHDSLWDSIYLNKDKKEER